MGIVARWYRDKRGIEQATLDAFGITIEDENEVVRMPYPGATKYRKGLEKEDGRKFWWDPPGMQGQALFTPPDAKPHRKMILVEGETDTMALWQHAPAEVKPTIRGLPGTESWKAHFADEFAEADTVFVILDQDDPYNNPQAAASTERGWALIRSGLGMRKARRVMLPGGVNDVAEFLSSYSWAALKVLLDAAAEVKLPFQRLVLSDKPVEYDWLVEGLIAKGDVVSLTADPGVGKSWLGMDLGVSVLGLREQWLGMKVMEHGPVVFVDQEQPEAVARRRLQQLGVLEDNPDLHYLWYQGVRLDAQPELLYEYCDYVRPKFLMVDSISRVHFKNENSAEEMNPLLNGGVYPLARELGITVLLLHHKARAGNMRGSTALPAATDLNLSMEDGESGPFKVIRPDKLRAVPPWGDVMRVEIVDDDARVVVRSYTEAEEDAY
jgi:KaiC/GvpD/RAD55 family RecA-like ATPase